MTQKQISSWLAEEESILRRYTGRQLPLDALVRLESIQDSLAAAALDP